MPILLTRVMARSAGWVRGGARALASGPLLDSHGRLHDYLRISLTERCNLRCRYCMPLEGVPLSPRAELLSSDEMERLARLFAALGVHKVRLTGGEPTLRADLPALVARLKALRGMRTVALTTNGLTLTRQLPALQRAGLDVLNVSLDTLRPDRFEHMARRPARGLARVLAGVDLALQLGYAPLKINCVLVKGFNEDEVCDFVKMTRDRNVEVRFIEFMPFSGNEWDASRLVGWRKALTAAAAAAPAPGLQPLPGSPHDTAKRWAVPGWAGVVGFISSMTEHFCAGCNRLRLTADGNLKVCLFGASEVSLRDAVRAGASDDELAALIRDALNNKKPSHAGAAAAAAAVWAPRVRERRAYCSDARLTHLDEQGRARMVDVGAKPETRRVAVAPAAVWAPRARERRAYCSDARLTHLDEQGRARMVDVGAKPETRRVAVAACSVRVAPAVVRLLRSGTLPKGDALVVAEVAGVLAAKRAADLLPLCHPLPLECARVSVRLPAEHESDGEVRVECEVRVCARTGAEMEALTGAAVAALALYDMCKSADKAIVISDLRLLHKSGGRSGSVGAAPSARSVTSAPSARVSPPAPAPLPTDAASEVYAPTNFPHL